MNRWICNAFQTKIDALVDEMHADGHFLEAMAAVAYSMQHQLTAWDRKNVIVHAGAYELIMRGVAVGIESKSTDRHHVLSKIGCGLRCLTNWMECAKKFETS